MITALPVLQEPGDTGTHTGNLWTTTGDLLASKRSSGERGSGWQQVDARLTRHDHRRTDVRRGRSSRRPASIRTDNGYFARPGRRQPAAARPPGRSRRSERRLPLGGATPSRQTLQRRATTGSTSCSRPGPTRRRRSVTSRSPAPGPRTSRRRPPVVAHVQRADESSHGHDIDVHAAGPVERVVPAARCSYDATNEDRDAHADARHSIRRRRTRRGFVAVRAALTDAAGNPLSGAT